MRVTAGLLAVLGGLGVFSLQGAMFVSTNTTVYSVDNAGLASVYATGFTSARGLAMSSNGDLFVADFGAGKVKTVSGGNVTDFSLIANPYGLLFDGSTLLVSQFQASASVISVDSTGTVTNTVNTGYSNLTELAFGTNGDLFVGSGGAHGVLRRDLGVYSIFADTSVNGASYNNSSISTPRSMVFADGKMYVADSGTCTGAACYEPGNDIQVFDAGTGAYLSSVSSGGGNPQGLAFDIATQLLYVARNSDSTLNTVDLANLNAVATFSSISGAHSVLLVNDTNAPEPASALLIVGGLGLTVWLRRRKTA
ncbi:MAG: hypothetical protein JWN34_6377 [Bryobacterales bacterium]|nr:hypothetical protein [Bryobacterales bacterium]